MLSLSNANVEHTGTMSNHVIDTERDKLKELLLNLTCPPAPRTFTQTDSTWEKKSQVR